MKGEKALPPKYLMISVVVMVALHFLFPGPRLIPTPWNLAGLIPLALGTVLNIIADGDLRKVATTVKPFEESAALVSTGAYRISRHPMYLGFVLILIGLAVLLGTPTPWVVIPVFIVLMERVFIVVEERMLDDRFAQVWLDYRNRVRRWI